MENHNENQERIVARLAEDEQTQTSVSLNFSPGSCHLEIEYQLINKTNLSLILKVERMKSEAYLIQSSGKACW